MARRVHFFFSLVKAVCATVVLASIVYTFLTVTPALETRYFPVFSRFEFVSVTEKSPGVSEVVVAFEKVRNCEPAGYDWFLGSRDGGTFSELSVQSINTGSSTGRPLGRQLSLPFNVLASPEALQNVFINVYHRCPFEPWVTKSEVYP